MEKWVAGIDIGGTSIKLAFLTMEGDIVHKWEIPTNKSEGGKWIVEEVAASIKAKLEALNLPLTQLKGVGAGAPGPIDTINGLLFEAVNLGWGDRYPLRNLLEEALGLPVAIDNDANCAALGEMWKGAGNGASQLICITLGTGVGGGLIVDGEIVHGTRGAAGEIGHITAVPEGGYQCNCGKTGCLETVASATGLVRLAEQHLKSSWMKTPLKEEYERTGVVTAKDISMAALNHDPIALKAIDDLSKHLGLALANAAGILNPERIVIGGGVSKAGDMLLQPIRHYFDKFAFKPISQNTEIGIAQLGNDAGVIGAAWLAAHKL